MNKVKKFKEKSNIETLTELMRNNNGYITSKLITNLGFHRMYLSLMESRNIIKKVASGIYVSYNKKDIDNLYIFSLNNPKAIFSHLTALHLYGIYDKEKNEKYDITVPHKYHNKNNNIHNVHYITDKYYKLGIKEIKTPNGNIVYVYDVNKSICDIIKNKVNEKTIRNCMKKYIEKYNDLEKLIYYADNLKVKDQVLKFYEEAKRNLELK